MTTDMQTAAREALVTAETNRMSAALGPSAVALAPLAMNAGIRAQWVAALRSSEFEQGHHRLRDGNDRCCCMGVLCVLAERAGVIIPEFLKAVEYAPGQWTVPEWVYGGSTEYLPRAVAQWAGLRHLNPVLRVAIEGVRDEYSLSGLNDTEEWAFPQIADAIEGTCAA